MCMRKLYAQAFVLMLVVSQDEEVVSVPLAASISLHAALMDGEIGGEVGVLLEAGLLDEFSALAAFILHEAANATSFYRTYLLLACIVGTCLFVWLYGGVAVVAPSPRPSLSSLLPLTHTCTSPCTATRL